MSEFLSSANYSWHFGLRSGGEDKADSVVGKFFKEQYASLVRESIQNSLDVANDPTQPVTMTFKFDKMELPKDSSFFELKKYINGCLALYNDEKTRTNKSLVIMKEALREIEEEGEIHFLEVSDENTIGMDYCSDITKQSKTRFYSFSKSVGNSIKSSATTGGSYGFGKAVFYNASKIRTIFVSSQSTDESGKPLKLFEGISSLCTSLIDSKKYEATGYFCMNEDEEPTMNENFIPERFRRSQLGSSVYVMGVSSNPESQEDALREIKRSVVQHFWLSILNRKLVVKIGNEEINSDVIRNVADEVYNNPEEYNVSDQSTDPRKFIEAVYLAGTDANHLHITDDLNPELGKVQLYILKERKASDKILYMRKTEMLIKTEPKSTRYGYYAVFVCEGDKGNETLRTAEDPTHTEWKSTNCDNEQDRGVARAAIRRLNKFIKDSIQDLFTGNNSSDADISGAQDYLYMNVSLDDIQDPETRVLTGSPSGEIQDEDSSSQTTIQFGDIEILPTHVQRHGHVVVEDITKAVLGGEDILNGSSDVEIDPNPNPNPDPNPIINNEFWKEDENGKEGKFGRPIKVNFHPFFQKERTQIVHNIRITADKDVENGTVEILVSGSDEKNHADEVYIDSVNMGHLDGNRISGLTFKQGEKLLLKVIFEDNLLHPIELRAYECKK